MILAFWGETVENPRKQSRATRVNKINQNKSPERATSRPNNPRQTQGQHKDESKPAAAE